MTALRDGRTIATTVHAGRAVRKRYRDGRLVFDRTPVAPPPPAHNPPRILSLTASPFQIRTDLSGIPTTINLAWSYDPAGPAVVHQALTRIAEDGSRHAVPFTSPVSVVGLTAPTDSTTVFELEAWSDEARTDGNRAVRRLEFYRGAPTAWVGRGFWSDPNPPTGSTRSPLQGGGTWLQTYLKWSVTASPAPVVTLRELRADDTTGQYPMDAGGHQLWTTLVNPAHGSDGLWGPTGSLRRTRTTFGSARTDLFSLEVVGKIRSPQGSGLEIARNIGVTWPA